MKRSDDPQADLAAWRAMTHPKSFRPEPRPKMTDPGSAASNRYLTLITTHWHYPQGPYPLTRWTQ